MPKCDAKDLGFPCDGEVKKYSVKGTPGHLTTRLDWGTFYYCEAHAEEDRRRGFVLNEVDEQGNPMPNTSSSETIRELWETIEFLNCELEKRAPAQHPPRITGNIEQDMIVLIKNGEIIRSVKYMRDVTRCNLNSALATMKRLRQEIRLGLHGEYDPQLVQ